MINNPGTATLVLCTYFSIYVNCSTKYKGCDVLRGYICMYSSHLNTVVIYYACVCVGTVRDSKLETPYSRLLITACFNN